MQEGVKERKNLFSNVKYVLLLLILMLFVFLFFFFVLRIIKLKFYSDKKKKNKKGRKQRIRRERRQSSKPTFRKNSQMKKIQRQLSEGPKDAPIVDPDRSPCTTNAGHPNQARNYPFSAL